MKATFQEVLKKVIESKDASLYSVNRNMMEISKQTKKKPGFVKVAIDDETAIELMARKLTGFMIFIDGDQFNSIAESLTQEEQTNA